jgi:drug/metabolite transporter (DMT)-like permease
VCRTELTGEFPKCIKVLLIAANQEPAVVEMKNMKAITWIGILLVVAGVLALAYQGINYTRQEKMLDIGPIHATAEKHERIPLPPIIGGLALVGGIVLLLTGARKKA